MLKSLDDEVNAQDQEAEKEQPSSNIPEPEQRDEYPGPEEAQEDQIGETSKQTLITDTVMRVCRKDLEIIGIINNANYSTITTLDLSENLIYSLQGLQKFESLQTLRLQYNKIDSLEELDFVTCKDKLKSLSIRMNPLTIHPNYRFLLIRMFPNLERLDDLNVNAELREAHYSVFVELSKILVPFLIDIEADTHILESLIGNIELTKTQDLQQRTLKQAEHRDSEENVHDSDGGLKGAKNPSQKPNFPLKVKMKELYNLTDPDHDPVDPLLRGTSKLQRPVLDVERILKKWSELTRYARTCKLLKLDSDDPSSPHPPSDIAKGNNTTTKTLQIVNLFQNMIEQIKEVSLGFQDYFYLSGVKIRSTYEDLFRLLTIEYEEQGDHTLSHYTKRSLINSKDPSDLNKFLERFNSDLVYSFDATLDCFNQLWPDFSMSTVAYQLKDKDRGSDVAEYVREKVRIMQKHAQSEDMGSTSVLSGGSDLRGGMGLGADILNRIGVLNYYKARGVDVKAHFPIFSYNTAYCMRLFKLVAEKLEVFALTFLELGKLARDIEITERDSSEPIQEKPQVQSNSKNFLFEKTQSLPSIHEELDGEAYSSLEPSNLAENDWRYTKTKKKFEEGELAPAEEISKQSNSREAEDELNSAVSLRLKSTPSGMRSEREGVNLNLDPIEFDLTKEEEIDLLDRARRNSGGYVEGKEHQIDPAEPEDVDRVLPKKYSSYVQESTRFKREMELFGRARHSEADLVDHVGREINLDSLVSQKSSQRRSLEKKDYSMNLERTGSLKERAVTKLVGLDERKEEQAFEDCFGRLKRVWVVGKLVGVSARVLFKREFYEARKFNFLALGVYNIKNQARMNRGSMVDEAEPSHKESGREQVSGDVNIRIEGFEEIREETRHLSPHSLEKESSLPQDEAIESREASKPYREDSFNDFTKKEENGKESSSRASILPEFGSSGFKLQRKEDQVYPRRLDMQTTPEQRTITQELKKSSLDNDEIIIEFGDDIADEERYDAENLSYQRPESHLATSSMSEIMLKTQSAEKEKNSPIQPNFEIQGGRVREFDLRIPSPVPAASQKSFRVTANKKWLCRRTYEKMNEFYLLDLSFFFKNLRNQVSRLSHSGSQRFNQKEDLRKNFETFGSQKKQNAQKKSPTDQMMESYKKDLKMNELEKRQQKILEMELRKAKKYNFVNISKTSRPKYTSSPAEQHNFGRREGVVGSSRTKFEKKPLPSYLENSSSSQRLRSLRIMQENQKMSPGFSTDFDRSGGLFHSRNGVLDNKQISDFGRNLERDFRDRQLKKDKIEGIRGVERVSIRDQRKSSDIVKFIEDENNESEYHNTERNGGERRQKRGSERSFGSGHRPPVRSNDFVLNMEVPEFKADVEPTEPQRGLSRASMGISDNPNHSFSQLSVKVEKKEPKVEKSEEFIDLKIQGPLETVTPSQKYKTLSSIRNSHKKHKPKLAYPEKGDFIDISHFDHSEDLSKEPSFIGLDFQTNSHNQTYKDILNDLQPRNRVQNVFREHEINQFEETEKHPIFDGNENTISYNRRKRTDKTDRTDNQLGRTVNQPEIENRGNPDLAHFGSNMLNESSIPAPSQPQETAYSFDHSVRLVSIDEEDRNNIKNTTKKMANLERKNHPNEAYGSNRDHPRPQSLKDEPETSENQQKEKIQFYYEEEPNPLKVTQHTQNRPGEAPGFKSGDNTEVLQQKLKVFNKNREKKSGKKHHDRIGERSSYRRMQYHNTDNIINASIISNLEDSSVVEGPSRVTKEQHEFAFYGEAPGISDRVEVAAERGRPAVSPHTDSKHERRSLSNLLDLHQKGISQSTPTHGQMGLRDRGAMVQEILVGAIDSGEEDQGFGQDEEEKEVEEAGAGIEQGYLDLRESDDAGAARYTREPESEDLEVPESSNEILRSKKTKILSKEARYGRPDHPRKNRSMATNQTMGPVDVIGAPPISQNSRFFSGSSKLQLTKKYYLEDYPDLEKIEDLDKLRLDEHQTRLKYEQSGHYTRLSRKNPGSIDVIQECSLNDFGTSFKPIRVRDSLLDYQDLKYNSSIKQQSIKQDRNHTNSKKTDSNKKSKKARSRDKNHKHLKGKKRNVRKPEKKQDHQARVNNKVRMKDLKRVAQHKKDGFGISATQGHVKRHPHHLHQRKAKYSSNDPDHLLVMNLRNKKIVSHLKNNSRSKSKKSRSRNKSNSRSKSKSKGRKKIPTLQNNRIQKRKGRPLKSRMRSKNSRSRSTKGYDSKIFRNAKILRTRLKVIELTNKYDPNREPKRVKSRSKSRKLRAARHRLKRKRLKEKRRRQQRSKSRSYIKKKHRGKKVGKGSCSVCHTFNQPLEAAKKAAERKRSAFRDLSNQGGI